MIEIGFTQHAGAHLASQQDSLLINRQVYQQTDLPVSTVHLAEPTVLLALADGISGSPGAARASRILLKMLADAVIGDGPASQTLLEARTIRQIHERFCEHPSLRRTRGASTTLAALHVLDQRAAIVNCGDSRVYRIKADGTWQQLSHDHTILQEFREQGLVDDSREYASIYHGLAHCIMADPTEADFALHRQVVDVEPGDMFVLTTDGVHETLGAVQLQNLYDSGLSLAEQVERWRVAVLKAGAPDNFSLVLCHRR